MRRNKKKSGEKKARTELAVRDANGFDEYRCVSEAASGFNLQKEDEKTGGGKEQRAESTVEAELFMLPTLRTDDKNRTGKGEGRRS